MLRFPSIDTNSCKSCCVKSAFMVASDGAFVMLFLWFIEVPSKSRNPESGVLVVWTDRMLRNAKQNYVR